MSKRKDGLQRTLWAIVMWIFVIFYAFALGVYATEKCAEEEAVERVVEDADPYEELEAVERAVDDAAPCEEPAPVLDVCEDTYLIEGHALDYEIQMLLYGACLEMGVDYQLALAVVEQETQCRNLMGDGGESAGYMQVQEKWHKDRMALLGVSDLRDPEGNFRVGCHFLRECIDKYGLEKGLGYYNSGKAAATDYSREVLGRMQG